MSQLIRIKSHEELINEFKQELETSIGLQTAVERFDTFNQLIAFDVYSPGASKTNFHPIVYKQVRNFFELQRNSMDNMFYRMPYETYDEEMDEVKHEEDESKMDEAKKKKSISASGLITFDQLKQAVFQEYGFEDDEDVIESFKEVNDLGDLVMLLDDLGYNDEEAYEFIIKAILK